METIFSKDREIPWLRTGEEREQIIRFPATRTRVSLGVGKFFLVRLKGELWGTNQLFGK